MNTLLPFLNVASSVVAAAAATLSLADAIMRHKVSRATRSRRR